MSLYIGNYSFARENASELNKLLNAVDVPEGLEILGNYTFIDEPRGFTIFRANHHKDIVSYTQLFRSFIDEFVIRPIEPVSDAHGEVYYCS
jgi:hypothetical protein